MARVTVKGSEISATKWLAIAIPIATAGLGALVAVLSMLLIVPSDDDLKELREDHRRVHTARDANVNGRLARMEGKLDRLLERP